MIPVSLPEQTEDSQCEQVLHFLSLKQHVRLRVACGNVLLASLSLFDQKHIMTYVHYVNLLKRLNKLAYFFPPFEVHKGQT